MYYENDDFNFKEIRENGRLCGYYKRIKLSNGQIAAIYFERNLMDKIVEWNVCFIISKKKYINAWLHNKLDMEMKITGKCGLEGLIWAKNSILNFEKFIINRNNLKNRIVISWSDNKREKAYKYLERYNYKIIIYYGKKTLIKNLF